MSQDSSISRIRDCSSVKSLTVGCRLLSGGEVAVEVLHALTLPPYRVGNLFLKPARRLSQYSLIKRYLELGVKIAKLLRHNLTDKWTSTHIQRGESRSGKLAYHSGSVSRWLRLSTAAGVRWKTYRCLDQRARCGTAWIADAPVPIMATRLSFSFSRDGSAGDPPVTE